MLTKPRALKTRRRHCSAAAATSDRFVSSNERAAHATGLSGMTHWLPRSNFAGVWRRARPGDGRNFATHSSILLPQPPGGKIISIIWFGKAVAASVVARESPPFTVDGKCRFSLFFELTTVINIWRGSCVYQRRIKRGLHSVPYAPTTLVQPPFSTVTSEMEVSFPCARCHSGNNGKFWKRWVSRWEIELQRAPCPKAHFVSCTTLQLCWISKLPNFDKS